MATPTLRRATLVLALAAGALPVHAQTSEVERLRATTTRLINLLVEQGLLTRARAAELLREIDAPAKAEAAAAPAAGTAAATAAAGTASAAAPATGATAAAAPPVRVPYVPETVRRQIKDEVRTELAEQAAREGWAPPGSVPDWVRRIRWEGDIRPRYQADLFQEDNAAYINVQETNRTRTLTLLNTTEDRHRLRVRARLGMDIEGDAGFGGGIRLSTGGIDGPVSANQTLGTYGNRFVASFDRAFVRYTASPAFSAAVGRVGNPWFGTDMVWANDLSFDGILVQWRPQLGQATRGFVTAAAMPVQEVELTSADKWLYGLQGGFDVGGGSAWSGRLGLGYYDYSNLVGRPNEPGSSANDWSAPVFAQKGNTYFNISSDPARPLLALASDYRLVNLTGNLDLQAFGQKRLVLTVDWVRNLGFDRSAVSARVGQDVAPKVDGYQLRALVGDASALEPGRWQAFLTYRHLERDAVPDAFTDGDLRGGGTDVKGYTLGGSYGVARNASLNLRWLSGDSISGPPLSLDTLQLDLFMRF